ncbi:hypothetical protein M426DRAFT_48906, partial [Hypoxylon sp. CI-4A]
KKTEANPYGLTPGESPFPGWQAPSAEQCDQVFHLLKNMHGDVGAQAPEVIPAPSLEVAGCGEVPSVLDALLRTYISGAVTMDAANKMVQNLSTSFGVLEEGIGKGSIDWNNVRVSPQKDLAAALRVGGLADKKSGHIKAILEMVYQENIERREAYLRERETGQRADVFAAGEKTEGQKEYEIKAAEQEVLSLDHLHGLATDVAISQLTKYPGIGVKTAACVTLFCLQRPCFAVDTHAHRFARWLGWVPKNANPDKTFSHLEVRCPDQFKYGLHQLFIRHGKTCEKCKGNTAQGTENWKSFDECPLESIIDRFSKKQ